MRATNAVATLTPRCRGNTLVIALPTATSGAVPRRAVRAQLDEARSTIVGPARRHARRCIAQVVRDYEDRVRPAAWRALPRLVGDAALQCGDIAVEERDRRAAVAGETRVVGAAGAEAWPRCRSRHLTVPGVARPRRSGRASTVMSVTVLKERRLTTRPFVRRSSDRRFPLRRNLCRRSIFRRRAAVDAARRSGSHRPACGAAEMRSSQRTAAPAWAAPGRPARRTGWPRTRRIGRAVGGMGRRRRRAAAVTRCRGRKML